MGTKRGVGARRARTDYSRQPDSEPLAPRRPVGRCGVGARISKWLLLPACAALVPRMLTRARAHADAARKCDRSRPPRRSRRTHQRLVQTRDGAGHTHPAALCPWLPWSQRQPWPVRLPAHHTPAQTRAQHSGTHTALHACIAPTQGPAATSPRPAPGRDSRRIHPDGTAAASPAPVSAGYRRRAQARTSLRPGHAGEINTETLHSVECGKNRSGGGA